MCVRRGLEVPPGSSAHIRDSQSEGKSSRLRKNCLCTRELRWFARVAQRENSPAGCSKSLSSKAAASEEARRTLRYVEPLSEARTTLADFFSILLETFALPLENRGYAWYSAGREWVSQYIRALDRRDLSEGQDERHGHTGLSEPDRHVYPSPSGSH